MSRFFKDNSPAKKAKPEQTSDGADSDAFKTVGEVYPGFVCPLDQKVLLKKYTKTGRPWIVCSGNVQNDPDSCQFSANLFGRDRVKEGDKSKIACQICDVPAEFTPSIGEPTGEKNPLTGKPVFENTQVFFPHCWGKQTEDPVSGKSLLVHCTAATGAVVGTTCKAYDPTTPFDDLKLGCTGDINPADIIIRSWALKDPPQGLHARCAKRKHTSLVKEILAAKKYRKDSGTNAEDEAKAPSVEVPADFEDF